MQQRRRPPKAQTSVTASRCKARTVSLHHDTCVCAAVLRTRQSKYSRSRCFCSICKLRTTSITPFIPDLIWWYTDGSCAGVVHEMSQELSVARLVSLQRALCDTPTLEPIRLYACCYPLYHFSMYLQQGSLTASGQLPVNNAPCCMWCNMNKKSGSSAAAYRAAPRPSPGDEQLAANPRCFCRNNSCNSPSAHCRGQKTKSAAASAPLSPPVGLSPSHQCQPAPALPQTEA